CEVTPILIQRRCFTIFTLSLSGSSIRSVSGRRRIIIGNKTEGATRNTFNISTSHRVHRHVHQFIYTLLAEVILFTATIDELVHTDTGGIYLTSFTFHSNLAPRLGRAYRIL